MKIRTKLFGGFILVAVIGIFLGAIGLYSNNKLTVSSEDELEITGAKSSVSAILSAHYNWRHSLSETVYAGVEFSGSLDPGACALGRWLNSDEVKKITDPEVTSLLRDVIEPHNFIHQEARVIINNLNS